MSDHFVVGKEYEITGNFRGMILDKDNPDDPHPMYKDNPEQCTLSKGDKFVVTEMKEVIENDEWPNINSLDDLEWDICTGYVMKAKIEKLGDEGTVYLTSAMLDRKEIVEVDHTRLN